MLKQDFYELVQKELKNQANEEELRYLNSTTETLTLWMTILSEIQSDTQMRLTQMRSDLNVTRTLNNQERMRREEDIYKRRAKTLHFMEYLIKKRRSVKETIEQKRSQLQGTTDVLARKKQTIRGYRTALFHLDLIARLLGCPLETALTIANDFSDSSEIKAWLRGESSIQDFDTLVHTYLQAL